MAEHLCLEAPPCVLSGKKDYYAMVAEMDEAGITHAVLWGRKSPNWGDVPNSESLRLARAVSLAWVQCRFAQQLASRIK